MDIQQISICQGLSTGWQPIFPLYIIYVWVVHQVVSLVSIFSINIQIVLSLLFCNKLCKVWQYTIIDFGIGCYLDLSAWKKCNIHWATAQALGSWIFFFQFFSILSIKCASTMYMNPFDMLRCEINAFMNYAPFSLYLL